MTDLSILIVSYKGWNRLIKCLEALDSFSGQRFSFEVIVVDNKSDDGTIYGIEKRFNNFTFVYNKVNGGYANGCNVAAAHAKGDYYLILNPDTVASETEVEKLLIIAKGNPNYGIVSCRQVSEKGKECIVTGEFPRFLNLTGFQRALFSSGTGKKTEETGRVSFPDWISGSVVLLRSETFRRCDGLDEDFWMYFEDVDLCRRVRDMNLKVACIGDITIEHNHGGSSRINLKTATLTKTEVHISRHLYISKHKSGFEKVSIQVFLVLNNLITSGLTALPGVVLFFVPKLFVRTLIFVGLLKYYSGALSRFSWISPRSVNSRRSV
jgi:GT2 family glycosyltransferase